jgi:hypothetical protein
MVRTVFIIVRGPQGVDGTHLPFTPRGIKRREATCTSKEIKGDSRGFKGDRGLLVIQMRRTPRGIRGDAKNPAGELITINTNYQWSFRPEIARPVFVRWNFESGAPGKECFPMAEFGLG